jgi:uncharacterized protein YcfL
MNDRELDQKLKIAKRQADKFFSNWKFEPCTREVEERVNSLSNTSKSKLRLKTVSATVASLVIILILTFASNKVNLFNNNKASKAGTPILEQLIKLDDYEPAHLINFFQLNNPNGDSQNLLAVLWELDSNGKYQMIYNSILEDVDIPEPVEVMEMPVKHNKLVLISSKNIEQNHLHYRVMSYDNHTIKTLMEENYVPNGSIEIRNGMIIEKRIEPVKSLNSRSEEPSKEFRQIVTLLVPYQYNEKGDLVLSTNYVRLKRGEYLGFIGSEWDDLYRINYKEKVLKEIGVENNLIKKGLKTKFQAVDLGIEMISIEPKNRTGIAKKLLIEVVDPQ